MKCQFCSAQVKSYTRIRLCNACYAFMYFWKRKGIKAILIRQQKLELFDARLAAISGNIVQFHHRRKAA